MVPFHYSSTTATADTNQDARKEVLPVLHSFTTHRSLGAIVLTAQRLARLIHVLTERTFDEEHQFDLSTWRCGTSACAVGWALQDTWFNQQGLLPGSNVPFYDDPCAGPTHGWWAVDTFFGLPPKVSEFLFDPEPYGEVAKVQPHQVISRIYWVLEVLGVTEFAINGDEVVLC